MVNLALNGPKNTFAGALIARCVPRMFPRLTPTVSRPCG